MARVSNLSLSLVQTSRGTHDAWCAESIPTESTMEAKRARYS
jgi:hypothetical protein